MTTTRRSDPLPARDQKPPQRAPLEHLRKCRPNDALLYEWSAYLGVTATADDDRRAASSDLTELHDKISLPDRMMMERARKSYDAAIQELEIGSGNSSVDFAMGQASIRAALNLGRALCLSTLESGSTFPHATCAAVALDTLRKKQPRDFEKSAVTGVYRELRVESSLISFIMHAFACPDGPTRDALPGALETVYYMWRLREEHFPERPRAMQDSGLCSVVLSLLHTRGKQELATAREMTRVLALLTEATERGGGILVDPRMCVLMMEIAAIHGSDPEVFASTLMCIARFLNAKHLAVPLGIPLPKSFNLESSFWMLESDFPAGCLALALFFRNTERWTASKLASALAAGAAVLRLGGSPSRDACRKTAFDAFSQEKAVAGACRGYRQLAEECKRRDDDDDDDESVKTTFTGLVLDRPDEKVHLICIGVDFFIAMAETGGKAEIVNMRASGVELATTLTLLDVHFPPARRDPYYRVDLARLKNLLEEKRA